MQDSRERADQPISGSQLKFARELLSDFWDEAISLTRANNEETGAIQGAEFAPDKERYLETERLGFIVSFTLRLAGRLVGYCLMFVSNHLHYPSTVWAVQDTLFVSKSYRGLGAVKFIKWIDSQLKGMSINVVIRQVSSKLDYSRTLERMGYGAIETGFIRRLA